MNLLTTYQIYYKPEQLALCEREYNALHNLNCDEYFENRVMTSLILDNKHLESEYFAVVSYKLREKVGSVMKDRWKNLPEIANHSNIQFTPALFERVLRQDNPDVLSFQRHMPHDPILVAERFHPGFIGFWEQITAKIGLEWQPTRLESVFYCNFFAARSEIYERYVKEALLPAIRVMQEMDGLWGNSRYPHPLPAELAGRLGVKWYPFHPFLCERLFSWWAFKQGLNCSHF